MPTGDGMFSVNAGQFDEGPQIVGVTEAEAIDTIHNSSESCVYSLKPWQVKCCSVIDPPVSAVPERGVVSLVGIGLLRIVDDVMPARSSKQPSSRNAGYKRASACGRSMRRSPIPAQCKEQEKAPH